MVFSALISLHAWNELEGGWPLGHSLIDFFSKLMPADGVGVLLFSSFQPQGNIGSFQSSSLRNDQPVS